MVTEATTLVSVCLSVSMFQKLPSPRNPKKNMLSFISNPICGAAPIWPCDFLNLATSYARTRSADAKGYDVGMCLLAASNVQNKPCSIHEKAYISYQIHSVEQFQSAHADFLNLLLQCASAARTREAITSVCVCLAVSNVQKQPCSINPKTMF